MSKDVIVGEYQYALVMSRLFIGRKIYFTPKQLVNVNDRFPGIQVAEVIHRTWYN